MSGAARGSGTRPPGGRTPTRPATPAVRVAAAVIRDGGRVLMTRRPPGGPLGLQWEFPGGKIEPGESVAQALAREIEEELGARVTVGAELEVATHAYEHGLVVEIHFVACELGQGALVPGPGVHEVRWSAPGEVDPAEVLEADRPFLARLSQRT